MAEAPRSVWPSSSTGNYSYGTPQPIVPKANTRMTTGLAPWLHQATGGAPPAMPSWQGFTAPSSTPWYQSRMDANTAAQAAMVQSQRNAIAAQKAQAEMLRQQQMEAERNRLAPGAYFDEQSGTWLMDQSGGRGYYSNGQPIYEGRSGDE